MLRLPTLNETPPGQWRYRCPNLPNDIAWIGPFHAFQDLKDAVINRCRANSVTPPVNLDADIQDQICRNLPPGKCKDENGVPYMGAGQPPSLDLSHIKAATATLWSWMREGGQRVSKDEIYRRTLICAECPYNTPLYCASCAEKSLRDLISAAVGGSSLPSDNLLHICGKCSCSLKAKTRLPVEIIRSHTSKDIMGSLPEKCWIKEGN